MRQKFKPASGASKKNRLHDQRAGIREIEERVRFRVQTGFKKYSTDINLAPRPIKSIGPAEDQNAN